MSDNNLSHPSPEQLEAYRAGKLRSNEAAVVALHLANCEPCAQRVANQTGSTLDGGGQPAEPHPDTTAFDSSAIHLESTLIPTGKAPADQPEEVPPALANHPRYHVQHLIAR